jgi:hypothetical protein
MYKLKVAKTRLKNNKGTEVMIGVCIDKQQIYDLNSAPSARTPQLTNTAPAALPTPTPVAQIAEEKSELVESKQNTDVADNAYVANAKVDLDKINSIL